MKANTGKILFVDLSNRTFEEKTLPEEVYEKFLGGVGLAAYVLYHHIPAGADPLGPDNILGFVGGALTGSGALFGGRWLVVGKSPLTGGWGDANCGGNFGPAIKQCGYDGIFFSGIASEPVYLYADGEKVEIRSAAHLWGKDAVETEEILVAEASGKRKARVATIGEAGEKLSLISGVTNDRGRLAARSGLGAVMGSKKLKAVALAGGKPIQTADLPRIKELSKQTNALIPQGDFKIPTFVLPLLGRVLMSGKKTNRMDGAISFPALRTYGTVATIELAISSGDAPIKNWGGYGANYRSNAVNPQVFHKREIKKYHCYACPLGCGAIAKGPAGYAETHRPEYETSVSLGAMLLNQDSESIFLLNEILNRAGMDSISAGGSIAFAIECFENGLITEKDTGGLLLKWGNTQAIVKLAEMMIKREGFGDILADGVRAAAQKIGRGAEQYAVHAGGQELSMHDPRLDPGFGVHYMVEPTPGRHTVGSWATYEMLRLWNLSDAMPEPPRAYPTAEKFIASAERGRYAAGNSIAKMVVDCAGLCMFCTYLGLDRFPVFDYLNAACGWNKTADDYFQDGRRVQTLRQMFNIKHGIEPKEVTIHPRAIGNPPLEKGANKGKSFDLDAMRRDYWTAMGWDPESGHPTVDTVSELGLAE